jgi:hypothetical protein
VACSTFAVTTLSRVPGSRPLAVVSQAGTPLSWTSEPASEEGRGSRVPASASGASNAHGGSRHALSSASDDEETLHRDLPMRVDRTPWRALSDQCPMLYPACSRCARHARHVQRQKPTQRGILTEGVRAVTGDRRSGELERRDPRRDVRAADLQEKPTKASRTEAIHQCSRFVGSDEDGGAPANIAASEASH